MAKKVNNVSRRRVLKRLSWFALLPAFWFGSKLAGNFNNRSNVKRYEFPLSSLKEVNFFEKFIIIRKDNKFTVLSSKCTHLGCKINIVESDNLICSCHGSKFDLEGRVLRGPATESLKVYKTKITKDLLIIDTELST